MISKCFFAGLMAQWSGKCPTNISVVRYAIAKKYGAQVIYTQSMFCIIWVDVFICFTCTDTCRSNNTAELNCMQPL